MVILLDINLDLSFIITAKLMLILNTTSNTSLRAGLIKCLNS